LQGGSFIEVEELISDRPIKDMTGGARDQVSYENESDRRRRGRQEDGPIDPDGLLFLQHSFRGEKRGKGLRGFQNMFQTFLKAEFLSQTIYKDLKFCSLSFNFKYKRERRHFSKTIRAKN
jgi:hypothetical protein